MSVPEVIGWPLEDAEQALQAAQLQYTVELSRPTKDFFPLAEECLYVIRQRVSEDGSISLTVAARQRREVS